MALQHEDVELRVTGSKAAKAFVAIITKQHWSHYVKLIQLVIDLIKDCLMKNQEVEAVSALESLAEVAELEPKMLRPIVPEMVDILVSVCNEQEFETSCRKLSLEVLVLLCESAGSMMRKLEGLAERLLNVCLGFMMMVEFDDGWSQEDKPVEDDEDCLDVVAEWAIDRIANSLHGKVLLPPAFATLPAMLEQPDWRQRYVACLAIAGIGEGCHSLMKDHLGSIVEKVLPLLQDQEPAVRYAACSAIGQMSIDFASQSTSKKDYKASFQAQFHSTVISSLIQCVAASSGHFRVQGHAIGALINFCDRTDKQTLVPYLDAILTQLGECLSVQSILVQEGAVSALATMADTARSHFANYYSAFIVHMKSIIAEATAPEHKMLRAKTLECATLMGVAVGKEVFGQDALEIMNILKSMEDAGMKSDDPAIAFTLTSWARLCEVLKEDFMPFLPHVLPPLVESAKIVPTICTLEDEETEEDLPDEGRNWEVINIIDARIGIKTSALEEKRVACDMLVMYARHLGPHFAPVVEQMDFVLGHLKFMFEDGVRSAAANLIPFLIKAYVENEQYGVGPAVDLWNTAWPALVDAAKDEGDLEVATYMLTSISQCVAVLEQAAFSQEMLAGITELVNTVMDDFNEMAAHRYEQLQQDEDLDEQAMAELSEDELARYMLIAEVASIIHVLYGHGKSQFDPYFERVSGHFVNMLGGQRHVRDLHWALCVFDDVIEHSPQHSLGYAQHFAQTMVTSLEHEDYEVRQAAAYGIGVMAREGQGTYAEVCVAAAPKLLAMITAQGSRMSPASAATDNAIAALVRVARAGNHGLTEAELMPQLVSWLPLTEDDEELEYVFGYLIDMIESQNPLVADPAVVLQITVALCKVVGDEGLMPLDEPFGQRAAAFLHAYLTQGDKSVTDQLRAFIASDEDVATRMQTILA
eukprot:TRINITY_DN11216_c0_g2_i1.p1 TRINITY_DN11216_c0_g2~~TRINITY_DN11216_c0_g2_i1.p1  ORF type:complete len:956 (+),score=326.75 TRINITY_DN11216_c0_g2_i1:88-2868(+)